jgi:uncharacterized metal-binding protein
VKHNLPRRNFLATAGAATIGAVMARGADTPANAPAAGKSPAPCCAAAPKLIFPCSGSSDVGGLADLAARKMTVDGSGKMYCLAAIGGRIPSFVESTKAATKVLAIDGCPEECARKTLEGAGIKTFTHLKLADMGFAKGKTQVTAALIQQVCEHGARLLTD